ncbi:hypothetical protein BJ928_104129 [Rhizobium sp. WW_1]|jgi:hypothetical protein|nr:hypothetical protein BJ928_104129 [Rhizobium sp. WW_1]
MSISAAIRRMLEAGLTIEQALVAAEAFEAESNPAQPVLSARQARNKRYYDRLKASEKRLNSDDKDVSDGGADLLSPEGSSPTPPSPKPQSSIPPSPPKGGSSPAGFEDFWAIYPNRVGKRDAEKSFAKALSRANLPEILAGLRRYVAKTDDRPWCNPATWLNQDRWTDDPAHVPRQQAPPRERTIFDAIDDFTGRYAHELSAGTTIDHDGGDYSPNVHLLASTTRR